MFARVFKIVVALSSLFLISAYAEPAVDPDDVIHVTGTAQHSFKTSTAVIRLGIEANGETAIIAQGTLATESTRLLSFLKEHEVKKVTTSGFSLHAQRNYKIAPPLIIGYKGTNTMSVEVPVESAGAILDGAVKNGASKISGVSFKASPKTSRKERKAVIIHAVHNARTEASIAVEALGKRLGAPKYIRTTITPGSTAGPQAMHRFAAPMPGRPGPPPTSQISGGEESIMARVSIAFKIETFQPALDRTPPPSSSTSPTSSSTSPPNGPKSSPNGGTPPNKYRRMK